MGTPVNELGFYLLSDSDAPLESALDEVRHAEQIGLGTAFITERWRMNLEAASLAGAVAAVTDRIKIATAAANLSIRHPVASAAWAATMSRLSRGRFSLGIGPGSASVYRAFGMDPITTDQMRDWAQLMRRIWSGEVVRDHRGAAGVYPVLMTDVAPVNGHMPLTLVAFDDADLALGGELFDDVVLHTFLTPAHLRHAVGVVKDAAAAAGRDPEDVRVWSCLVTVPDTMPESTRLQRTVGRLSNYLQYFGDEFIRRNGWDPAQLERFLTDPLVRSFPGPIEGRASVDQLRALSALMPPDWPSTVASGTAEECAERVSAELACGADHVILHGASAWDLEPIVAAYRAAR